ncbi:MAG: hypothetical protein WKG01_19230 [Kofleriaceae bacterium]
MSTRLPPISFQVLRWSLVGRWSGTINRHEAWNVAGGPRSEKYEVSESTLVTLLPAPQADEEDNVRGARVISPGGSLRESPLVYPLWFSTRVFTATYTSAYSQIDDWIEIDQAAQVANRGAGRGDHAKVSFKLYDYGDAAPLGELTSAVWRKIDLCIHELKLKSTSEWNAATGYPQAIAHDEDLAFTTHSLLPGEGFRVRSTQPQPHPAQRPR